LRKFLNSKAVSLDELTLIVGTILSQALPLAFSPILTRLYTPEDMGLFSFYFSLTMILSVVVTMRYEMAIMLPRKDEDAKNLVVLSLIISTVVSVVIFVIVLFFKKPTARLLRNPDIENWLFLVPATIFCIGTYQAFNYWSNRKGEYKQLAQSRILRASNTGIYSVIFGLLKKTTGGLIVADTLAQAVSSAFLGFRIFRKEGNFFKSADREKLKKVAREYKHFPLFNTPSGLLEKSSSQVPVVLFASLFSTGFVGLFSHSQRIISQPGAIVARAIGDVFRQKATELYNETGNCRPLFISNLKRLLAFAILPFVTLAIFGPQLFAIVFGEEWRIAGVYAQYLTPMFFLQFITSPLSIMFLVAQKQKIDLYLQIALFSAIMAGVFVSRYIFHSTAAAVIIFGAIYSAKYLVELYLSYTFTHGNKQ